MYAPLLTHTYDHESHVPCQWDCREGRPKHSHAGARLPGSSRGLLEDGLASSIQHSDALLAEAGEVEGAGDGRRRAQGCTPAPALLGPSTQTAPVALQSDQLSAQTSGTCQCSSQRSMSIYYLLQSAPMLGCINRACAVICTFGTFRPQLQGYYAAAVHEPWTPCRLVTTAMLLGNAVLLRLPRAYRAGGGGGGGGMPANLSVHHHAPLM